MSPPTAAAPHVRGHPPGDMGYGMYSVQCACVRACVRVYTHTHEVSVPIAVECVMVQVGVVLCATPGAGTAGVVRAH